MRRPRAGHGHAPSASAVQRGSSSGLFVSGLQQPSSAPPRVRTTFRPSPRKPRSSTTRRHRCRSSTTGRWCGGNGYAVLRTLNTKRPTTPGSKQRRRGSGALRMKGAHARATTASASPAPMVPVRSESKRNTYKKELSSYTSPQKTRPATAANRRRSLCESTTPRPGRCPWRLKAGKAGATTTNSTSPGKTSSNRTERRSPRRSTASVASAPRNA